VPDENNLITWIRPRASVVQLEPPALRSSGGLVAQRFAIDHPERTLGLVLLGVPLRLGDKEPVRQLYSDVISRLTDPIDPVFVRDFNKQIAQHVPPELFESLVEVNLKAPARVWRQTFEGAMNDDFSAELECISAPTLVLWGDQDTLLTRDDEEALALEIPNARLVVYEGVGHLLYVEQPERVARDLAAFVEAVSLGDRGTGPELGGA
jgi:pimeloyl-ACP methyl ester carboxylesterase